MMEPTGIEPVTSCLQSDLPITLESPFPLALLGFSPFEPPADMAGLGAIRLGLGSNRRCCPKPARRPRATLG
jgi:hypothetical protein